MSFDGPAFSGDNDVRAGRISSGTIANQAAKAAAEAVALRSGTKSGTVFYTTIGYRAYLAAQINIDNAFNIYIPPRKIGCSKAAFNMTRKRSFQIAKPETLGPCGFRGSSQTACLLSITSLLRVLLLNLLWILRLLLWRIPIALLTRRGRCLYGFFTRVISTR